MADLAKPTRVPASASSGGNLSSQDRSLGGTGTLDHDPEHSTLVAIMSGVKRSGEWMPPDVLHVVAVMGGVELDFRRAVLPPGVTELRIAAVMGGVNIIVPRDVDVEVTATAFLGGVDQAPPGEEPAATDALPERRPLLVVGGFAIMGGINVKLA